MVRNRVFAKGQHPPGKMIKEAASKLCTESAGSSISLVGVKTRGMLGSHRNLHSALKYHPTPAARKLYYDSNEDLFTPVRKNLELPAINMVDNVSKVSKPTIKECVSRITKKPKARTVSKISKADLVTLDEMHEETVRKSSQKTTPINPGVPKSYKKPMQFSGGSGNERELSTRKTFSTTSTVSCADYSNKGSSSTCSHIDESDSDERIQVYQDTLQPVLDDNNSNISRNATRNPDVTPKSGRKRKGSNPKKVAPKNLPAQVEAAKQLTVDHMSQVPFKKLVCRILEDHQSDMSISPNAIRALQLVSEGYITCYFMDAILCATHGKRVTVMKKDFELVKKLRASETIPSEIECVLEEQNIVDDN